MEIRFSKLRPDPWGDVYSTARSVCVIAKYTKAFGMERCRFTLPEANESEHDSVIRALLTLDPDATVRTARAVYECLADFEAQYKARNGGEK